MKWISVNDELPYNSQSVLAYIDGKIIECVYSINDGFEPIFLPSHGCGKCCNEDDPPATHWMPIIDLPS
jgi:Protein of unknown function (DUF551).